MRKSRFRYSPAMNVNGTDWLFRVVAAGLVACLLLAVIVGLRYVYDTRTLAYALIATLVVAVHLGVFGWHWQREGSAQRLGIRRIALWSGLGLGVLWMIEILYNNLLAPPLPGRDIVDDVFWALVGLGLLTVAGWGAYQQGWLGGVRAGVWSGFGSGLVACLVAEGLIVLGMGLITRDPLNVSEWNAVAATSGAPSMAAYFAFETLAGALVHLLVLGTLMGALAGGLGGVLGFGARWLWGRPTQRPCENPG